jgi:hypothetical protein
MILQTPRSYVTPQQATERERNTRMNTIDLAAEPANLDELSLRTTALCRRRSPR